MTTETLRQKAERYIATECVSRGEWSDLVRELLAAIPQWTAVSERLPDDDQTVLIAMADGEVWTGWHDGDEGWRYVSADKVESPVAHWAPALEGPK